MHPRPPLYQRLRSRQRLALDIAAAAGYGLVVWAVFAHKIAPSPLAWSGTALAAVALGMCRRWPLPAFGAALACFWLAPFAVVLAFLAMPPMACVLYQVASHFRLRTGLVVLGAALTGPLATALPGFTRTGGILPFAAALLIAFAAGYARGAQRRYSEELVRHHAGLAEAERERARRGAAEERMRIARELHDVVAHGMSVITVQAGFGHLVIDDQPGEARTALGAIEAAGRQTLAEMRQLLDVLRADGTPALDPAPGLAELDQLISQAAQAGIQVDLDITGRPRDLPAGIEVSVYRIVQEALTNVIKHAGPCAAQAVISYLPRELAIEVTDDGRGGPVAPCGLGLAGMRERVHIYGGQLDAGPLPAGGFRVTARLPLPAAAQAMA
jgi:signal transduction histidine kinase